VGAESASLPGKKRAGSALAWERGRGRDRRGHAVKRGGRIGLVRPPGRPGIAHASVFAANLAPAFGRTSPRGFVEVGRGSLDSRI